MNDENGESNENSRLDERDEKSRLQTVKQNKCLSSDYGSDSSFVQHSGNSSYSECSADDSDPQIRQNGILSARSEASSNYVQSTEASQEHNQSPAISSENTDCASNERPPKCSTPISNFPDAKNHSTFSVQSMDIRHYIPGCSVGSIVYSHMNQIIPEWYDASTQYWQHRIPFNNQVLACQVMNGHNQHMPTVQEVESMQSQNIDPNSFCDQSQPGKLKPPLKMYQDRCAVSNYDRKSSFVVYAMRKRDLTGDRALGYIVSPEFKRSGIVWSCVIYPKGVLEDSSYMDVKVQLKTYIKDDNRSVIFRVSLLSGQMEHYDVVEEILREDGPRVEADNKDEFVCKSTKPYYLNGRNDFYDRDDPLLIRNFGSSEYLRCMFRGVDRVTFRVEMEESTQLSTRDQLKSFLMWTHAEIIHSQQSGLGFEAAEKKFAQMPHHYHRLAQGFLGHFKLHQLSCNAFQQSQVLQQEMGRIIEETNEKLEQETHQRRIPNY